MKYIDTNVFIRYLTNDVPKKSARCKKLFKQAEQGLINLYTSESTVAEVIFVLSSKKLYNFTRDKIYVLFIPLLSIPAIKIQDKPVMLLALDLYRKYNFDFADAVAVAYMAEHQISKILSYDTDFDQVVSIKRVEP